MAVYLRLFHGRKARDEVLEDWGSDGPILGPFQYVHTTYACHIKLGIKDSDDSGMQDLHVVEDMVYYGGVWYGDWTIFGRHELTAGKHKAERYDPEKAEPVAEDAQELVDQGRL